MRCIVRFPMGYTRYIGPQDWGFIPWPVRLVLDISSTFFACVRRVSSHMQVYGYVSGVFQDHCLEFCG